MRPRGALTAAASAWIALVAMRGTVRAGPLPAPSPPSPSPSPRASPSPSPSAPPLPTLAPPPRPITQSVEPVVERMEEARKDPCKQAREQGQPCFPVTTTQKGETYSVRQSLGLSDPDKTRPTPGGAPSGAEMKPFRPGIPREYQGSVPVTFATVDPGCLAKSLVKSLKGKNNVYYLYRLRDRQGERVALYDSKLDPTTFQGEMTFLGRFEGECAALGALRHEELVHPTGPPSLVLGPPASPSPSPGASPAPSPRPSPALSASPQ